MGTKSSNPNLSKWQHNGSDWLLLVAGHVHASITRDGSRWLCYSAADNGDDGLLGPARNLTAAKAFLERYSALAFQHDIPSEATAPKHGSRQARQHRFR